LQKFLITNAEFLEFVRAGGYLDASLWTEAGWQWRNFRNVLFPTYWVPNGPVCACVLFVCLFLCLV
jgi:formylglycine-generating enzyme required for sulfatase activity